MLSLGNHVSKNIIQIIIFDRHLGMPIHIILPVRAFGPNLEVGVVKSVIILILIFALNY